MNEDSYKGVLIRCREYKLADDRGFMASFTLVRSVGSGNEEMPYGPTRSFKTRELAREAAMREAHTIIDQVDFKLAAPERSS